jgi:hypothetical protein
MSELATVGGVIVGSIRGRGEMKMAEEEVHRTATEARAASKPGVTRYVLAIGLALVILAYIVILLV